MQQNTFLLYGANGYTGELIARFAGRFGLQPVLAGRNEKAISTLAGQLQLPWCILSLENAAALLEQLTQTRVVVNAAGPYDITARPMVEACLQTGTHYIDLNGDMDVFTMLQSFDGPARERGIMLLPGAGFDVVPTDCLALWLKNQLPDADTLEIAFAIAGSRLSRGTAITTLQKLGLPGAVRTNGHIIHEQVGKRGKWVRFTGSSSRTFTMSIPWGDVSTAWISTRIPNIITYTGVSRFTWLFLRAQAIFNPLLRSPWMHRLIKQIILRQSAGPSDAVREKAASFIKAAVSNTKGQVLMGSMHCPEAYSLTADATLLITQKILQGNFTPGYHTPSTAYGADLVMEIAGVTRWLETDTTW